MAARVLALALLLALAAAPPAAAAPATERVAEASAEAPALSRDGRFVAFATTAALAAGDDDGASDVYLRDRLRGRTTRISARGGFGPTISGDGRTVAYIGVRGGRRAILVHDRRTGRTRGVRVRRGERRMVVVRFALAPGGRYVAVVSGRRSAPGPAGQDLERVTVSVVDLRSGRERVVLRRPFNDLGEIALSSRRQVALTAGARLVRGDRNRVADVYVAAPGRRTRLVSAGGDGPSGQPAISPDGRYVAFASGASTLVDGDTNGEDDVFVRDRRTGRTTRASLADDGAELADASAAPSISADGRMVAFHLSRGDVIADVSGPIGEALVRDRRARRTAVVSESRDGVRAGRSGFAVVSADGRQVAFASAAEDLVAGDGNGATDVFVRGPLP